MWPAGLLAGWVDGLMGEWISISLSASGNPHAEAHGLGRFRGIISIVNNINDAINSKACIISYQEINPEIKGL